MSISITATSGKCFAACSKNAIGSVKVFTLIQPAESRSRPVDLRIEESSSSRYTVSLLSATILNLPDHNQNRIRVPKRSGFVPHQNRSVVRGNSRHATTLACQISETQSDLSPGSDHRRHFRFLQHTHKLGYRRNPELLH